jgi:ribulose-5-phosphate 4-epimerase/fuculose-1-phosphate aldolase
MSNALAIRDRDINVDLLPARAQVALLGRALWREGYADHTAGHITLKDVDGTLLTNPFTLAWDEVRASDVVRIDRFGNKLEGQFECSPAIALHVELHRARPDVTVAVHHHPEWATVWAALHELPEVYDQTSAMIPGDVALYEEYVGDVIPSEISRQNIEALGDRPAAILANHGVLVVAPTVKVAHLRCVALEWRCKMAWRVQVLGEGRGRPMSLQAARTLAARVESGPADWPHYFEAAVRRELRRDPSVLE